VTGTAEIASPTLLGGTIALPEMPCRHSPPRFEAPWTGEPSTSGTVSVVGAGKMGLPLAAQFASHGWRVVAVDVNASVVATINQGVAHVAEEPGLADRVAEAHAAGRLRATTDAAAAARESDVIVLIVPVMLDEDHQPDYRYMDAAVDAILPGLRAGTIVVFETTLPVGDTRGRYAATLEASTGLAVDRDVYVAFSPERLFSGAVFRNLATYPKLVGGIGPASTDRACRFYASVLDAEVVAMSSAEAAELSKLAETTYRDLNIAFANELAAYASRVGVDVLEAIRAANSQPYSHIHQPGLGVGGHCIPVYPHFLLSRGPELELVALARRVNDDQVSAAVERLRAELGTLDDAPVLVLGLTYREGVKELAYSRAIPLIEQLRASGARVSAWDPLLSPTEIEALGAVPWTWASPSDARAILTQTADRAFTRLDAGWFPALEIILDGRNSLREFAVPPGVRVLGVGVPTRGAGAARDEAPA
jgi:nucleotide sugar dehydrogenase